MKHTLIHKFKLTILFLLLGLAISVAPTLPHETSSTFDGYPAWSQVDRLVLVNSPDSEYPIEELPTSVGAIGVDVVTEVEWDEPDSEYSTEELSTPVRAIDVDVVTEVECDESDSEY